MDEVTYELTRDDVTAIGALLSARLARSGASPKLYVPLGWAMIVIGVLNLMLHVGWPSNPSDRAIGLLAGSASIFAGVLFLVQMKRPAMLVWRRPRAGSRTTLAWRERGVRLAERGRAPLELPWLDVASVEASATIVRLRRPFGPSIVVPRRAFADDGVAFLAAVEDRIVGKRLLIRSTPSTAATRPFAPDDLT